MKNQTALEQNIKSLTFLQAGYFALFMQPILIFYYQTKGLSIADFFYLQPIFSITMLLSVAPLGYMGDQIGRKKMLILATVLQFLGAINVLMAENIWHLIPAGIIFGISTAALVGSNDALLYDTLIALKREKEHKKHLGKIKAFGQYSLAIAAIASGFLFEWDEDAPAYASCTVSFITIIFALMLTEPKRKKKKKKDSPLKEITKVVKYTLHGHSELKWIILFTTVISVASIKGFWLLQPLFQSIGMPVILIGIISACFRMLTGISSQLTHRIEKYIQVKQLMAVLIVLVIINYTVGSVESLGWWIAIPLSLVFISEGISRVINHDLIQQRVSSDIRGTVVSVESMIQRLQFAIITPLFGYAVDAVTLQFAMICMAIFVMIGAGLAYTMLTEKKTI